jgi:uncharacterized protein (TIGR04255 family)
MSKLHYSKAPIIEAVIDIQVAFQSEVSIAQLNDLADTLKDQFSIRQKLASVRMQMEHNIQDEEKNKTTSSHEEIGVRLVNEANTRTLVLKKTGLTYSHLPPYSDWDQFSKEARGYWDLFVQHCKPEMVTRSAVRYINRIDIPNVTVEIEDYLNLYPHIPDTISPTVTGMNMQLQMPQDDIGSMAIINEAVVEPAIAKGFSIIVDIDLINSLPLEPNKVWDTLEQLHIRKNDIFEGIITDNTRELIR